MVAMNRNGLCGYRGNTRFWTVLIFMAALFTMWPAAEARAGSELVSSLAKGGRDVVKGRASQAVGKQAGKPDPRREAVYIAGRNNILAFDLYARLRRGEGNLFFSPYSITGALAMLYAGSGGRTMKETASVLHAPGGKQAYGKAFSLLKEEIGASGREQGVRLENADSLWMQQGYAYRVDFSETVKRLYGAEFSGANFILNPDAARRKINDWTEARTGGMIKDLLREGTVGHETRFVLADAVFFSGLWASAFDPALTTRQPFHVDDEKSIDVPMMTREGRYRMIITSGVSIIELLYINDRFSMIVILPEEGQGMSDLEKILSVKTVEEWLRILSRAGLSEVELSLPRFALADEFDLRGTLAALGMKSAFSGSADFSGITLKKNLSLSLVVHKACIEVKEDGTVASAATAAVMTKAVRTPLRFMADRPFFFMIRHNATGQILFMGRVMNPAG